VIVTVDDKIQSTKRCELSTVIITVHGRCLLGYIQSGQSYGCNPFVGVSCMRV